MESPFMVSAPLAWARPVARSPAAAAAAPPPPAPSGSLLMAAPPSSAAPAPALHRDDLPTPGPYDAHARYPRPYPVPYIARSPAPYVTRSPAPYVASYDAPPAPYDAPPAPYAAHPMASNEPWPMPSYVATQMPLYGTLSMVPYGPHQPYRAAHSGSAVIPYAAPPYGTSSTPQYDAQFQAPAAPPAEQGPFHFAHLVTVKLFADNYLL